MASITLTCICGEKFQFTEADQRYYGEKGFPQPKRCKPCRETKKASYDQKEKQESSPFHPNNMKKDRRVHKIRRDQDDDIQDDTR